MAPEDQQPLQTLQTLPKTMPSEKSLVDVLGGCFYVEQYATAQPGLAVVQEFQSEIEHNLWHSCRQLSKQYHKRIFLATRQISSRSNVELFDEDVLL